MLTFRDLARFVALFTVLVLVLSVYVILFSVAVYGQQFPDVTEAQLLKMVNSATTTLAVGIDDNDTTITLTDATKFVADLPIVVGTGATKEIVVCSGKSGNDMTGCTRAYDSTTARAHAAGLSIAAAIISAHHRFTVQEIVAIEAWAKDTVGETLEHVGTATPGASAIVRSGSGGKVASGWLPEMEGATDTLPGTIGAVPVPDAGDEAKCLKGNGTWGDCGSGGGNVAYKQTFTSPANPWTVTGAGHGLGADIDVFVQLDGTTVWKQVGPADLEITKANGDVTITWAVDTAGRIFISTLGSAAAGAGGGETNHALLTNLDKANSGHTGFADEVHGPRHKRGGADPVGTDTPGAYEIPYAGSNGKLPVGWLPDLSGTYQAISEKNQSSGYPGLTAGKVAVSQIPVMSGDAGSGGNAGAVPAQAAGDAAKCLLGNGTWGACGSGSAGTGCAPGDSVHIPATGGATCGIGSATAPWAWSGFDFPDPHGAAGTTSIILDAKVPTGWDLVTPPDLQLTILRQDGSTGNVVFTARTWYVAEFGDYTSPNWNTANENDETPSNGDPLPINQKYTSTMRTLNLGASPNQASIKRTMAIKVSRIPAGIRTDTMAATVRVTKLTLR